MTDKRATPSRSGAEDGDGRVWSAWRTVAAFGLVSLSADMVYEGARSVTGPFLASLGASALVVGLVTGAGEAAALVLRLGFGSLADRTGSYWTLTVIGYAMTAVCVPLLAIAPFLGGAGLAFACSLILLERTGKAVRSPAKSFLLAQAARAVGRGRGFAVHKALDQVGAFAGPLLVAGVIATTSAVWPAFAVLAVPGVIAVGLLVWTRSRVPDVASYDRASESPLIEPEELPASLRTERPRLPRQFYLFAVSAGASTAGLMTFGVISFHLVDAGLMRTGTVPLVYAMAMAAAAVAALLTGFAYDRWSSKVLVVLPPLVVLVPLMALSDRVAFALAGIIVWGAAGGVQDSTVKALVADLVPGPRLASAYGVFAAFQGVAAIGGGALAGALYTEHHTLLVTLVAAAQAMSLALLVSVFGATAKGRSA